MRLDIVKVEFNIDEAWNLMSYVVGRVAEESSLPDAERAKIRRWRSEEMRPTSEAMKILAEKINQDLARTLEVKQKSQIRKPDWR
jgi:hypothetical protein